MPFYHLVNKGRVLFTKTVWVCLRPLVVGSSQLSRLQLVDIISVEETRGGKRQAVLATENVGWGALSSFVDA